MYLFSAQALPLFHYISNNLIIILDTNFLTEYIYLYYFIPLLLFN
jgi:hypothetical protein